MKKYLLSVVIKEMKIKSIRYHFTPTKMTIIKKTDNNTVGKEVEKLGSSYIGGGNIRW